ncbi:HigA family addiction module antitoxin [Fibrella aquatilis]|uniref:HigA family addiction module antidote protein n=1 Tax=Fibrella aquatilis TaxID=2817059 RepID=A0A939G6M4_9BACT|nr:HigA family addiction module antitoxin [Fibrella aquatilis]MBO0932821.1 HigA family addiction module antidote protein [Fibrella aquatilis]
MHNPSHPGEILKNLYLDGANLTVTQAAGALGISRKTLSQIINGRVGISAQMALLLAQAFPTTTPQLWLNLQQQYDLWQAQRKPVPVISPLWQPWPKTATARR